MAEIGISSGAFKGQDTILSVNFGSECSYIGESAFEECKFLSEINSDNVITSIGKSAFASTKLSSITFNKLTTLEDNAFYECANLRNISIPNCGSIPSSAFCGCTALESVAISKLNSVGNNAFENCSKLNNINLEYCSSIGESAFASCSNISQIALTTCIRIGDLAFYNCKNLERVYIYNDPKYPCEIGSSVFYSDGNIIDGLAIIVRPDIYECLSDSDCSDWSSWNIYIDNIIPTPDEHTIVYTSTDGNILNTITSVKENKYTGRFGFLKFDESLHITCLNQLFKNIDGKNNLKSIEFSPEYTEIGNNALDGCVYLKNITLPNVLTKIGDYAFKNCKSFTTFNIPDTVTEIGEGIFAGCENIERFDGKFVTHNGKAIVYNNTLISIITKEFICDISNIDKNIQTLGSSCFHGSNNIKRLDIPANITTINANAFDGCENLCEIHFHGNTPSFTQNIFGNTIENENIKIFVPEKYIKTYLTKFSSKFGDSIISKIYPIASEYDIIYYSKSGESKNKIDVNSSYSYYKISNIGKNFPQDYFRDNANITKVILGEEINRIPKNTFYGCGSLEYVYVPDSIELLDECCFRNCTSLKKIHIPYGSKNNTSLDPGIFEGCTSLKEFETYYAECVTSDNRCYIQDGILKLFAPSGLDIYEIKNDGNNIHTIGEDVFRGTNLSEITLNKYIKTIDSYAFYGCKNLQKINNWDSIQSIWICAFEGCDSLGEISLPKKLSYIGENAFCDCKNMSIYTTDDSPSFPDTIQNIYEHAFDGTNCNKLNLKNVNFKKIKDYVFANCANLETVIISNKITEIGGGAFYNCGKLSSVLISNNSTNLTPIDLNLNKIGDSAFEECKQLKKFYLQPSLTKIGDRAFYNSAISDKVTIPTNVEYMGEECFCKCGNITVLEINSTKLTQISKSAFENCSNLTSISIPSNIVTIGENAFAYCDKLHSCNANETEFFSLPNTIERIEDSAFYKCNSIESFTLPTNLKRLGNECFYFYADGSSSPVSTKTITIPKGLEEQPKFYKGGIADRSSTPFRNATISIIIPQNYYKHYLMNTFWSKYRNYIKQGPQILG
jgi:hypothetical protein